MSQPNLVSVLRRSNQVTQELVGRPIFYGFTKGPVTRPVERAAAALSVRNKQDVWHVLIATGLYFEIHPFYEFKLRCQEVVLHLCPEPYRAEARRWLNSEKEQVVVGALISWFEQSARKRQQLVDEFIAKPWWDELSGVAQVEKARAEIRGRIPSRARSLDIIRRVLGSSDMQPDNLAVLEEWGVYSMLSVEDYSDCQLADLASRLQL